MNPLAQAYQRLLIELAKPTPRAPHEAQRRQRRLKKLRADVTAEQNAYVGLRRWRLRGRPMMPAGGRW